MIDLGPTYTAYYNYFILNIFILPGLDSYQEMDLGTIRERWTEALEKRREYLDTQMQKIVNKESMSSVYSIGFFNK